MLVKGGIVNLTVDKGTIQTPAKDNGDGTYTAIYTAGGVEGEVRITAIASNGKFAATTITLLPVNISLSTAKTKLPANSTSTLKLP